jgi:hypothetical protein
MKICDICRKTVTNLQSGPPELDQIEICGECLGDLLRRFSIVEKRLAETKGQWRVEAITEWQRERAAKE